MRREIACDESGWAGENLLDAGTDVFAHASVHMPAERAASIVGEVRERIGSPATEYKANHLLRARHRGVLEWLIDGSGPLGSDAHVYLVEKPFAVVRALAAALVCDTYPDGQVDEVARRLQHDGPNALGRAAWSRLLVEANVALRSKRRIGPPEPIGSPVGNGVVSAAVDLVSRRAVTPWSGVDPGVPASTLDPLLSPVVRSAAYWTADGSVVTIMHHRQNTLTDERIESLVADPLVRGRVIGIRQAGALDDARVQIADFLAGIARAIASAERGGHGDSRLTELLRPYLDRHSVWADEPSRTRLFG